MSTYSESTNELFTLSVRTAYGDEGYGEVWRSRQLNWRIFGWEGSVDIDPPTRSFKRELQYFRYRFTAQHFPYEAFDSEHLAAQYEEQK